MKIIAVEGGKSSPRGATRLGAGVNISVFSRSAVQIEVCFFDQNERQVARFPLRHKAEDCHFDRFEGVEVGMFYGLRASGDYSPDRGLFHDPKKLLIDPFARGLSRQLRWHADLALPASHSVDTAELVPKGMIDVDVFTPVLPLPMRGGGAVYELNVKGFSQLHQGVAQSARGNMRGLASDEIVSHLDKLNVAAVEMLPIAAWISERHLAQKGLSNSWGYNPVAYFAPDPALLPGGMADLRAVTDIYRSREIPVVLDVVYNHTGESDLAGPTLSFRGLDATAYYRWYEGEDRLDLINDTGTGNTLRCDHPEVIKLVVESLKNWVLQGGVSGFRFDLAPILGRGDRGFRRDAALLETIAQDEVLSKCILIAEPWDIGPGGYRLGEFGPAFAEWNDQFRDKVRGYWAGIEFGLNGLAASVAGSRELFEMHDKSANLGVNFLAAHDGFTLRDLVSFEQKHNHANGENNRDGHGHNLSWNCGVEGGIDPEIERVRKRDVRALLATLYLSRGRPMLQQGDEMWRTQSGNNNAYAQDNEISWVDWENADKSLTQFVGSLAKLRVRLGDDLMLEPLKGVDEDGYPDAIWWRADGEQMSAADWEAPHNDFVALEAINDCSHVLICFNRALRDQNLQLPEAPPGQRWSLIFNSSGDAKRIEQGAFASPRRSVAVLMAVPSASQRRGVQ